MSHSRPLALATFLLVAVVLPGEARAGTCTNDNDCTSNLCIDGSCAACGDGCPDQSPCDRAENCASEVCTNGMCAPPTCAPGCLAGASCGADGDCASGLCVESFCACVSSCGTGNACTTNAMCTSGNCVAGQCQAPDVPLGCAPVLAFATSSTSTCAAACADHFGAGWGPHCCSTGSENGEAYVSPICCPADGGMVEADGGTCPVVDAGMGSEADAGHVHLTPRDAGMDSSQPAASSSSGQSGVAYTYSASASSPPSTEGDASTPLVTPITSPNGCDCRASGSPVDAGAYGLFALAALAFVRRPRRGSPR